MQKQGKNISEISSNRREDRSFLSLKDKSRDIYPLNPENRLKTPLFADFVFAGKKIRAFGNRFFIETAEPGYFYIVDIDIPLASVQGLTKGISEQMPILSANINNIRHANLITTARHIKAIRFSTQDRRKSYPAIATLFSFVFALEKFSVKAMFDYIRYVNPNLKPLYQYKAERFYPFACAIQSGDYAVFIHRGQEHEMLFPQWINKLKEMQWLREYLLS